MTEPNTGLPRLAPGTYQLTKRIVVGENGTYKFVDEPGGEAILGFFHRTLTGVRPVVTGPGESDKHVAATIRTAIDQWHVQDDPAETDGVSMPEYIRRALADAGVLASDAAELALFRERDALTRKALKAEGDDPLQFLALHVRQQRDRATAERDEARARLRGMARRASMLRRSREKWRRLAGKQTHERVHDMAASMASNGQLRAENRRVKAERDEALAALAKLDRAVNEELEHRDAMEKWADKLAYAVAPVEVIGEHSNVNNPWKNALEILERSGYVSAMPDGSAR